jgi:3-methyl-2-oxobutanoate hydroxymethyltransferase
MPRITPQTLCDMKLRGEKFSCVTAYDATFAGIIDQAGIEAILVGDSLGMVLQGHRDTLAVSITDMAYHISAARRGSGDALLIGDMPFMSYATLTDTLNNSALLMRAGAQMVKLEGGTWLCPSIEALSARGIPVCAHLGLTPQSVNALGGFRVQGKTPEAARRIIDEAKAVEAAGATLLVIECVPRSLARDITRLVSIPVIGIGAGPETDGQVLVLHDLLGLNPKPPRFVQDFMAGQSSIAGAIAAFGAAVKSGTFPAAQHCFDG